MARRRVAAVPAYSVLAIGASWGGVAALSRFVAALPATWSLPVIIVQHQHPTSGTALERILSRQTALEVIDVNDKQVIEPGKIYIAPANYHLLVENDKSFSLSTDAPVNFSRPSIDVTFGSIVDVYADKCIGVILTGANEDGVEGMKRIHECGGFTVAQDPDEAEVPTMPAAAIAAGVVDRIACLNEIVPIIIKQLSHGKE